MSDGMGNDCPVSTIELWLVNNVRFSVLYLNSGLNDVSTNYISIKGQKCLILQQLPVWGSSYP